MLSTESPGTLKSRVFFFIPIGCITFTHRNQNTTAMQYYTTYEVFQIARRLIIKLDNNPELLQFTLEPHPVERMERQTKIIDHKQMLWEIVISYCTTEDSGELRAYPLEIQEVNLYGRGKEPYNNEIHQTLEDYIKTGLQNTLRQMEGDINH